MTDTIPTFRLAVISCFFFLIMCANPPEQVSSPSNYDELVQFFSDWRDFHNPEMIDGVPDYSNEAMEIQRSQLPHWQARLAGIDTSGWPVKHQVDWYLVWAEMNGLEFAHDVKKPWVRDPAFYVWFYPYPTDVPEREGPNIHGAIELPRYFWPLAPGDAEEIGSRLSKAKDVFDQAKINLTGNARDLWITGTRSIREQSDQLENFARSVDVSNPDLATKAREAASASDAFAVWLGEQSDSKTGTSGVGKENYSWNLRKVHLLPYSWEEEVVLMERELARAHSSLRLEENKNRKKRQLKKVDNAADYDKIVQDAIDDFMDFLEDEEIVSIHENMDPALRERAGSFTPFDGLRGFFSEIIYRDPMTMRAHHYHWFDLARMRDEPHESPIRRIPLLYNIFDGRAEGMATGMEEMMMHAGLYDDRPRGRELVWVMLAQRCARGLAGLYQHGLEMTFEESTEFASKWTPWGLLPKDGSTIQHEEQFYLQQPAYGTSYVIGKIEIEKLMAGYARQREGEFVLQDFMDEFNRTGIIPISLIHWEMTGDKSMLEKAIKN